MPSGNYQSNSGLRPTIWQKELYQDVIDNLYFTKNGMMGKDANNIIQIKDDLVEKKGNTVTFGLTAKMSGAGVTGDGELEGNEEKITGYSDSVAISKKRFAIRLDGKLDEQQAAYDLRSDAKTKLSIRLQEFIERQFFFKLAGVNNTTLTDVNAVTVGADCLWSNTSDKVPDADETAGYGSRYLSAAYDPVSGSGNNTNLNAAHTLTPRLISRLRIKAKLANPQVVPVKIDGINYYVLFIHPWQADDLKNHQSYREANLYAAARGDANPIFSGALGVWDGVIVHEHEYAPYLAINSVTTKNFAASGSGISYGLDTFRAVLCGAQAVAFAKCRYDNGWVEKSFDYDDKTGFATGLLGGIQKPTFNSKDYGVIVLDTAATPIA